MRSRLRMLLLPSLLATLAACETPTPTPATEAAPVNPCTIFGLITFDRLKDTPQTIVQIKAYNAGYTKLCGAGK